MKKRDLRGIIAIGLIFSLIMLIIMVLNGSVLKIDNKIYNYIAQFINDYNTQIFKVITFFGSTIFMIFITIILTYFYRKKRGVLILIIMLISTIINNLLKILIARPRPTILQLVTEKSYSFPSGHTMAITTLVGIILYLIWQPKEKRGRLTIILSLILGIIPFLIMLSRIYLGIHYFSDCLGGYIISIILILLFTLFIDKKFI